MKRLIAVFLSLFLITSSSICVSADEPKTNNDERSVEKFTTKYSGENMYAGRDIPLGNYEIVPQEGKIAYVCTYVYGGTIRGDTGDKRYIYSKYTQYSDFITIKENQYVTVRSGVLVPIDSGVKRDLKRNGSFIVGTDMAPGHYTFRLDSSSAIGFVKTTQLVDNPKTSMYFLNEDSKEFTVKLDKGTVLTKYGVDILNATLRMYADYSPVTYIPIDTNEKYNFADVRDSFKTKIISDLNNEMYYFKGGQKVNNRFLTSTVNDKIKSWKSTAVNPAEHKYADLLGSIYHRFAYFAQYSKPELTVNNYVEIYNKKYSGIEFKKILEAQRDAYMQIVADFSKAQNFTDCEVAVYNAFDLYSTIPNGVGVGKN